MTNIDWWNITTLMYSSFGITCVLIAALLLDRLLGEPKAFHPLIGFGYVASTLEQRFNRASDKHPNVGQKSIGAMLWLILVLPLPILIWFTTDALPWPLQLAVDAILLYLVIGLTSLQQHAMQVFIPLQQNNLSLARKYTGYLVSRNTSQLTPQEMARATIESVIENGHDAIIASLFYYVIGGIELAIVHRLANTLDAMWGYRNERFYSFGWFAARMDDLLGFVSGKVTACLYAIQGYFFKSLSNAYSQGNQYKSHNGGWTMAAGATALNITLGGHAVYHGQQATSIALGRGPSVQSEDIIASISLVKRAVVYLVVSVFIYQSVMVF